MSAIWDGDTGTITLVATKDGAPVNLTGTTSRAVIIRNVETGVSSTLTIASEDLPVGKVVANAGTLGVGTYKAVLRVVTGTEPNTVTLTYPSADKGAEVLSVLADLDAPA